MCCIAWSCSSVQVKTHYLPSDRQSYTIKAGQVTHDGVTQDIAKVEGYKVIAPSTLIDLFIACELEKKGWTLQDSAPTKPQNP